MARRKTEISETTDNEDDDLPPVPKSLKRVHIESDQDPIPESPSADSLSDSISNFLMTAPQTSNQTRKE